MTAETIAGVVVKPADFRTCQYTGLRVDVAAQALIKANAVAAVVFLLIGGVMGLLVALTRWPAGTSIWCVFDNTASGAAADDALRFGALLR